MAIVLRGNNTSEFSSSVSVGGTVTYDDVKEVDSVGIITARSGIRVTGGTVGIGSDNPNAALSVLSSAYPTVTITRDHASNYPRLRITNTSTDGADLDGLGSGGGFRIACVAAGVSTERFRVNSAGNVGIGADDPNYHLVVEGQDQAVMIRQGNGALAALTHNTSQKLWFQGGNAELGLFSDSSGNLEYVLGTWQSVTHIPLVFRTGNRAERMRITFDGNIGIGLTNPTINSGTGIHIAGTSAGIKLQNTNNGDWGFIEYADETNTTKFIEGYRDSSGLYAIRPGTSLNATPGISVDSTGRLGVGQDTHLDSAVALSIKNLSASSEHTFLDIYSDTNETGRVRFIDGGDNGVAGEIRYTHNVAGGNVGANSLAFFANTSNTPKFSVKDDGNCSISDGNLEVASGHGIDFSADGNLSGTTSELFKEYEEGTYTPTASNFSTTGTVTLSGRYVKVGRVVTVGLRMASTGTIAHGVSAFITLPFAITNLGEDSGLIGMMLNNNSTAQNSNKSGVQCKLDGEGGSRFFPGSFTTTSNGEMLLFGGTYVASA